MLSCETSSCLLCFLAHLVHSSLYYYHLLILLLYLFVCMFAPLMQCSWQPNFDICFNKVHTYLLTHLLAKEFSVSWLFLWFLAKESGVSWVSFCFFSCGISHPTFPMKMCICIIIHTCSLWSRFGRSVIS